MDLHARECEAGGVVVTEDVPAQGWWLCFEAVETKQQHGLTRRLCPSHAAETGCSTWEPFHPLS